MRKIGEYKIQNGGQDRKWDIKYRNKEIRKGEETN
jgi:hypothetical protein